jgi:sirohydrochlorin cobaltochelatase
MNRGLILFAHGARDSRWAEPFERLRAKIQAARPGLPVALAYLELMTPDLGTAVDQMVAAGCRQLRVVPVFLGQGGHVRRDLPELIDQAAARHAGLVIELAQPVGENDAVLDQMVAVCIDGLPR